MLFIRIHFASPRLAAALITLLAVCVPAKSAVAAGPLVAVAANFAEPMKAIAKSFEQDTGIAPRLSFSSSGKFFAQITNGAPFELFLSADQQKPIALEQASLTVPGSRFTYAEGSLVLWSLKPTFIRQAPASLVNASFNRLALANPRLAPYGAAALEVLQNLGIETETRQQWIIGENISQTFMFVDTGNADLGFVAAAQVIRNGAINRGFGWQVPAELHRPIKQDAVLLLAGESSAAAQSLFAYLTSSPALSIIQQFGYRPAMTKSFESAAGGNSHDSVR